MQQLTNNMGLDSLRTRFYPMTKSLQPSDTNVEKRAHAAADSGMAGAPITACAENVMQKRLKERDALKSFRLTHDSANSFTIDNGDGTHVKDKRQVVKDLPHKPVEVGNEKPVERVAQVQKATSELLENASRHFGAAKVQDLHIGKDDVGSALAVVALGPDICKSLGTQETHALGSRFLVFGVAPMFGMADEAKKQFTQHLAETAHAGAGNYLSGAAIGALLEHVHPAVLATAMVGGTTMFIKDQLSSPEHRARNREISSISEKIDRASNSELVALMGKTKQLLGPDLYKGTFDVVTGTPAIPEGAVLNAAVKDEAIALSKIDVKDGIKVLQNLGHEAWTSLQPLFEPPGLKPAFADAGRNPFNSSRLEESILRMQGDAAGKGVNPLEKLRSSLEGISKKPFEESTGLVVKANEELLSLSRSPVKSTEQAKTLAALEDVFTAHMRQLRDEMTKLRPQAEAIQAKEHQTSSEEKLVERFCTAEDAVYGVVKDRLETLYGLGRYARADISMRSGMGSQLEVAKSIDHLFNRGLDKEPVVLEVLKSQGVSPERAKDWVGISITGSTGADHAGCDYLLANKNTGEIYPLDITERVANMKKGALLESRLTNHDMLLVNKDVPNERKHLVIGLASEIVRDNARFELTRELKIPASDALKILEQKEKQQLAEIIAHTIASPSKLNLIDTPLPSARADAPASRQAYELWRFRTSLEEIGYSDWARSITKSLGYLRSQTKELPFYN